MKTFIFAAGFGERLRPITATIPKPLVPVLNRPAIEWSLALAKKAGIRHVICNLHHLPDEIERFFYNYLHVFTVTFSREPMILGTGGGLKKCEKLIGDEEFLLLNSDVIMNLDVEALLQYHRKLNSRATVVLYKHPNASEIAKVAVRDGKVIDFKNFLKTNSKSEYIYTGVAVLSPEIFLYLEEHYSSIVYT
ncbi:MAG: sugar phosphate nucleotidyltransferase, partial [Spirochaetes bacterium]|nr:sugar phosphate nucleotidyltransferase [Spirochaetota bacterium]